MAKFELAIYLVKKVEQGQRWCNCVNSQIFEGYPGVGGTDGKEVVDSEKSPLPLGRCVATLESFKSTSK